MQGFLFLKTYIEERVIDIANYIIDNNATVRKAAKQFGVSKSTAHKDVTTRLLEINPKLAARVRKILDINKQERHIRGGMATKENTHIIYNSDISQQNISKIYMHLSIF